MWKESDDSLKWYKGTVLSVTSGKDGDPDAVYEVQYDGEDSPYEVDRLIDDYADGCLTFIDV